MKNLFKEGSCFTNFDVADRACTDQCYVNNYCQTKTDERKKKSAATAVVARPPCSAAELEAYNTQFLKELNELLPRMEVQTFPKGQQHTFLDDKGKVRCTVRTVPNFNMQVVIDDYIFNHEAVQGTADIGDLMKKIRLALTKPDATTVQVPAIRSAPALPPVAQVSVVPEPPKAPVQEPKAESKAKAKPPEDDFSKPCGQIG